ncbi:MAG: EamA family transporter [Candidatus Omnitrophica bacterium]|nr:EamA family transporter [Candidatus Omnitrophota bacterium]MDD5513115.1 EamA family transporter [Candidatus Omnitrophota bacterium]
MSKGKITLKILIFLIASDLLETFTQFCFKKSAVPQNELFIQNPADAMLFITNILGSGFLWIGLASVILTFVIWSTILSKIDLSVAVPIASFSYILVPLVSIIFLGEKMSLLDWAGISFIIAGVIFVASSTEKETAAA